MAPPSVNTALRAPGAPLDGPTRASMEPLVGRNLADVRVHTGSLAAASAAAVSARAYTVGSNVVFGAGQCRPHTAAGRSLLAHELTHVAQQNGGPPPSAIEIAPPDTSLEREADRVARAVGNGDGAGLLGRAGGHTLLQRAAVESDDQAAEPVMSEQPSTPTTEPVAQRPTAPSNPLPEKCDPPPDMACNAASTPPASTAAEVTFSPAGSAVMSPAAKATVDGVAASWNSGGRSGTVRIDAYASAEGECRDNWDLSCRRARAVSAELQAPSNGSAGLPVGGIEMFAHGESNDAGTALAPNRRATLTLSSPPASPSPSLVPAPAATCLPVSLGTGRKGCGSGTDFTHFDRPAISLTSLVKLDAWAHALHNTADYRSVSNTDCETEMDIVLSSLAGADGHSAFARFQAGTGGTETLGSGTSLNTMALSARSFRATITSVRIAIAANLAAQMRHFGFIDPCAVTIGTIPQTHFPVRGPDPMPLKAVIGGTHGEELFMTGFTHSAASRTFAADLNFKICDNFGVDEADLYAPGLFPFWILQPQRSATLYAPFINVLDLTVTVAASF